MKAKPKLSAKQLLKVLPELFDDVGPETREEIDEGLRAFGYDPDRIAEKSIALVRKALDEKAKRLGIERRK